MIRNVLFGALGLAAIACLVFLLLPDEGKRIEKQLHQLSSQVSKKGQEKPLETLSAAAKFGAGFSDPCQIAVGSGGDQEVLTLSRKEITDRTLLLRKRYTWLTVALYDLAVKIGENKKAEVTATVRIDGSENSADFSDLLDLQASMAKVDGEWHLTRLYLTDPLENQSIQW